MSRESQAASNLRFEDVDVFVHGEGAFGYRIPALATTKVGTLIAVCDARIDGPGDAPNNIDLFMRRSHDNGDTWTPSQVIARFPGREAACDPSVLADPVTGTVWVFYDYAIPRPDQPLGRQIMLHVIRSHDDGATWSAFLDLTPGFAKPDWYSLNVGPGRGIRMRSGRLAVPVYSVSRTEPTHSHLLFSDDQGVTWKLGAPVGPDTCEPQVAELENGVLMLNMRRPPGAGCRQVAVSRDGGDTWSEARDEPALIEPGCQASLLRYSTPGASAIPASLVAASLRDAQTRRTAPWLQCIGDVPSTPAEGFGPLLFSNPTNRTERRDLVVRLSYDNGRTWPTSRLVHEGPCQYSCLTTLHDGTVGLLYEKQSAIAFARFTLAWVEEGRNAPFIPRERDVEDKVRKNVPEAWAGLRNESDLTLDGNLDDGFWDGLPVYELRQLETGEPPVVRTIFRVAWAGEALYFGIRCEEPDMAHLNIAGKADGDKCIWNGDVIELLFETQVHSYYQIAINPAGALINVDQRKWESAFGRSRGSPWELNTLWSSGAQAAAYAGDRFWSLEVRIPVANEAQELIDPLKGVSGNQPTPSYPWHINVCRQRIRPSGKELSAFSPTGQKHFLEVMKFGRLVVR
jgi:sialidase-1